MAWVHLALYPIGMPDSLAAWIGELTRFAAGSFVLISGMTVARVFGPKLAGSTAEARMVRRRLFRRAAMLLCVDRVAALAYAIIERFCLTPPGVSPPHLDIGNLAFFAEPGVTGGLLFLYAVLLLATPLLDAARRRFGGRAVVAVSLALYGIAYTREPSPHPGMWPFPVPLWQSLFVLGYVASYRLDRLRNSAGGVALWWRCLASGGFTALFLIRNGASLGLSLPSMLARWQFVKVPLSPAELAWYVLASAFVLTWSAWVWERAAWTQSALAWLSRLGRKSLLVYVAHLFIQLPVLELLTVVDPSPLWRTTMLPLTAAILLGVAAAGEQLDRALAARVSSHAPARAAFRLPTSGIVGSAVAFAALLAVITLHTFIRPPAVWNARPAEDSRDNVQGLATMEPDAEEVQVSEEEPDRADHCAAPDAVTSPDGSREEPALRQLISPGGRGSFFRRLRRNLQPRFIRHLRHALRPL